MTAFILALYLPYLIARLTERGGVSDVHITSHSILIAGLIGFIIAFAWERYRLPGGTMRVTFIEPDRSHRQAATRE